MAHAMAYSDIEFARTRHALVRHVIDQHEGPAADPRRLRRVLALCRELCEAIDDDYCRRKMLAVEEYAAELLSAGEHRPRGTVPGAQFLRQRIAEALELVQSRLYSLERVRRYGEAAFARRAAPRFAG
jgi:hypothetical protein